MKCTCTFNKTFKIRVKKKIKCTWAPRKAGEGVETEEGDNH